METIGTLGGLARARAGIDADGSIDQPPISIAWWVGADDGWHDPAVNTTTRFRRPGVAPSYETAVRVPAGDFVQRAYGVTTPAGSGAIAIDFDNSSRGPCWVALFVGVSAPGRLRLDANVLRFDDEPVLTCARRPRLWASGGDVHEVVRSGRAADSGPPEWEAPAQVALLLPVPHQTVFRTVLAREVVELNALADPETVERGWQRQLDRGLRTELPDALQHEVDGRRADLLLAVPSAAVLAALEDWGFDAEAVEAWSALGFRARRAARRRSKVREPWPKVPAPDALQHAATYLLAVRQLLVREHRRHLDLLPGFRPDWLGQNIAVHDLPLRSGALSFALRWHGPRPALLWEAPDGVELRAPALDPEWRGRGVGETLLAEPPAPLLAMGTAQRSGTPIDDPGSFG